jgi:hypothetical protein
VKYTLLLSLCRLISLDPNGRWHTACSPPLLSERDTSSLSNNARAPFLCAIRQLGLPISLLPQLLQDTPRTFHISGDRPSRIPVDNHRPPKTLFCCFLSEIALDGPKLVACWGRRLHIADFEVELQWPTSRGRWVRVGQGRAKKSKRLL